MNKTAIFIKVYKNRYTKLIDFLREHKQEIKYDCDIFLVAQENDPNINDYTSDGNIKLLVCNATNTCAKSIFILDYAYENGYDYYIQSDDDINTKAFGLSKTIFNDDGVTPKRISCSVINTINDFFDVAYEKKAKGLVIGLNPGFFNFRAKDICEENISGVFSFFVINPKIKDEGIKFIDSQYTFEDVDLYYQCLVKGIPVYVPRYSTFKYIPASNYGETSTSIIFGNDKNKIIETQNRFNVVLFQKYGGALCWKKGKIERRMSNRKLFGIGEENLPMLTSKKGEGLYNIVKGKEVTDELVNEVIEYLKEHKD